MMTFAQRFAKTIPVARQDRNRRRAIPFFGAFACTGTIVSYFALRSGDGSTALAMLYLALMMLFYVVSVVRMRPSIAKGREYWHHDGRRVIMTCPFEMVAFDIGLIAMGAFAGPLSILTWIIRTPGDWIGTAALVSLAAMTRPYLTPIIRVGGPTRRRISLTKRGVELIRINGHIDTIPWKAHPHLVGVRYQGDVIIALAKNREIHYPIAFLPLTLRQLDRLLRTLSTDGQLRADLAKPKALATVLTILEPTPDELTDGSWTWRQREPREPREPRPHESPGSGA